MIWSGTQSYWVHCEKDPADYVLHQLRKFNLPQELLKQFYSAIIETVLCTSITVWFSPATKSDLKRVRRVVRTAEWIIGITLPTLQELYLSRVSKTAGKITLEPYIQHTPSLNCYRLVKATELWAPELPDTGTDPSHEHTTLFYMIYSSHILIFHFKICTYQTCTHVIVYIKYCVCAFVYIACFHIYILIFLLSVSCPVAVILFHCGASVAITISLYV